MRLVRPCGAWEGGTNFSSLQFALKPRRSRPSIAFPDAEQDHLCRFVHPMVRRSGKNIVSFPAGSHDVANQQRGPQPGNILPIAPLRDISKSSVALCASDPPRVVSDSVLSMPPPASHCQRRKNRHSSCPSEGLRTSDPPSRRSTRFPPLADKMHGLIPGEVCADEPSQQPSLFSPEDSEDAEDSIAQILKSPRIRTSLRDLESEFRPVTSVHGDDCGASFAASATYVNAIFVGDDENAVCASSEVERLLEPKKAKKDAAGWRSQMEEDAEIERRISLRAVNNLQTSLGSVRRRLQSFTKKRTDTTCAEPEVVRDHWRSSTKKRADSQQSSASVSTAADD